MPLYEYKCDTCGEKAEVLVRVTDFVDTSEFTHREGNCDGKWVRVIEGAPTIVRGAGWGGGKGFWIFIAALFTSLFGCGSAHPPTERTEAYVAGGFADAYVADFVEQGRLRGVEVNITGLSVSLIPTLGADGRGATYLGVCSLGVRVDTGAHVAQIRISETEWSKMGLISRHILMFHELGHCLLGLDHAKEGVMATSIVSPEEFVANERRYLDVLFAGEHDDGK